MGKRVRTADTAPLTTNGGPADGALYSAVKASPSTCAGQPSLTYSSATERSSSVSVTRSALPSTTRSNGCVATLATQRASAEMLRDLRVPGPEVKYQTPFSSTKPTGVTCGEPSRLMVVSHVVCRFGPPVSGACVISEVSTSRTRSQAIGGAP